MNPNEQPCENCGLVTLRAHLVGGWCLNCAHAHDIEAADRTAPPDTEFREWKPCVLCDAWHARYSELCSACDDYVIRQFERVRFA